ncbi:hypothetical protein HGRIS_012082 [Hohenbuehelia grisea]|uniref:Uncharacterized protein n=1 Tax=Hohenbuehelia grisea TaxID=104357 RepID=A0ABR3IRB0_9AGAR
MVRFLDERDERAGDRDSGERLHDGLYLTKKHLEQKNSNNKDSNTVGGKFEDVVYAKDFDDGFRREQLSRPQREDAWMVKRTPEPWGFDTVAGAVSGVSDWWSGTTRRPKSDHEPAKPKPVDEAMNEFYGFNGAKDTSKGSGLVGGKFEDMTYSKSYNPGFRNEEQSGPQMKWDEKTGELSRVVEDVPAYVG